MFDPIHNLSAFLIQYTPDNIFGDTLAVLTAMSISGLTLIVLCFIFMSIMERIFK